jgi:hypothetical protein
VVRHLDRARAFSSTEVTHLDLINGLQLLCLCVVFFTPYRRGTPTLPQEEIGKANTGTVWPRSRREDKERGPTFLRPPLRDRHTQGVGTWSLAWAPGSIMFGQTM